MASSAEIESLPWLGTTWYERGPGYWARRVALSLLFLAVAVVDVAFLASIIVPMLQSSYNRPPGIFLLVLVVAVGAGMVAWMVVRARRMQAQASRGQIAASAAAGGAMGPLVLAGSGVGAFLFFVAAIATAGPMIFLFILSLTPELDVERKARARLNR